MNSTVSIGVAIVAGIRATTTRNPLRRMWRSICEKEAETSAVGCGAAAAADHVLLRPSTKRRRDNLPCVSSVKETVAHPRYRQRDNLPCLSSVKETISHPRYRQRDNLPCAASLRELPRADPT